MFCVGGIEEIELAICVTRCHPAEDFLGEIDWLRLAQRLSSTSRVLLTSAATSKGFCMKSASRSDRPLRPTMSSAYPDMNRTFTLGVYFP